MTTTKKMIERDIGRIDRERMRNVSLPNRRSRDQSMGSLMSFLFRNQKKQFTMATVKAIAAILPVTIRLPMVNGMRATW